MEIKNKGLVKDQEMKTEGNVFFKKRNLTELNVEEKVLSFFKNDSNFFVPRIISEKSSQEWVATDYIKGISVTKLFYFLDIIKKRNDKSIMCERAQGLKETVIRKILKDLYYFQSRSEDLLRHLNGLCVSYPYFQKLEESLEVAIDIFGLSANFDLLKGELREIADFLIKRSQHPFRDSTTNNVILNVPELENLSDNEAVIFILEKLENSDFNWVENNIYNIDFAASNYLTPWEDDVIHVLEHEMCVLDEGFVNKYGVIRGENYYLTMAARMFRFWARSLVYEIEKINYYDGLIYRGSSKFYRDKLLEALSKLNENYNKNFKNLIEFVSNGVFSDHSPSG